MGALSSDNLLLGDEGRQAGLARALYQTIRPRALLARLVGDHRLREDEAFDLARELTVDLPTRAYRFDQRFGM